MGSKGTGIWKGQWQLTKENHESDYKTYKHIALNLNLMYPQLNFN